MTDRTKHSTVKNQQYLTVIHTDKTPQEFSQLSVSYATGTGKDYKEDGTARPCIWIHGSEYFTGTWEELKEILKFHQQPATPYKYNIGQPVVFYSDQVWIIARYQDNGSNFYQAHHADGRLINHIPEGDILPY